MNAPGSLAWWVEHEDRLARRKPRAVGLTLERIVDEALALVDEAGLDALTVRALADRLSTASSSLYRHVASRDELLVLLVDRMLAEVPLAVDEALDPRARVERLALDLRAVLRAHPHVVPALRAAPLAGPHVRRASDHGLQLLARAGYEPDVAVPAFFALLDYVLGSVLFGSADSAGLDPAAGEGVFAFGLRTFLDGLPHASSDR